jgi:radical SAM superfamily enzyme YgiQ (UPF0313 family)
VTQGRGHEDRYLVRRADGWFTATPRDLDLRPCTIEAAAALLDGPDGTHPAASRHATEIADHGGTVPLSAGHVIAPVPYEIGRIEGRVVVVDDRMGALAALDRTDLAVLDAISEAQTVASVQVPLPQEDVLVRLARLAALGCIAVHDAGTDLASIACPRYLDDDEEHARPPAAHPDLATSPNSPPGRIPVYFIWHDNVTPLLSLGMLAAAARAADGGRLNERFELRRPELAGSALRDLAGRTGPAVLICSDYVFTLNENIDTARRAKALNPDLVVIHGGPSSPKYEQDIADFFSAFGDVADVLARGEGEALLCELLDAIGPALPAIDPECLARVDGIAYRLPATGEIVRTPDRARIADLDQLPSPYLTGEFDHVHPSLWLDPPMFETNRGCPYGCTYCDWGSATMSRIRKFDIERVAAEFEWAVTRGHGLMICDANFGILARDVEIAQRIADLHRVHGGPTTVLITPSKNRIKHLTKAFDVMYQVGIAPLASISLQTTDEATLASIARENISIDAYLDLAAGLRRRRHALVGDLIVGLPGQTYESYVADLQFMLDHEIMPRTFPLRMLPNSPMNDPEERIRHGVEVNDAQVVAATSTLSADERERVLRIHYVEIVAERAGLLRHIMRYLQWDLGIPATAVMEQIVAVVDGERDDYPLLTWVFTRFDAVPAPPLGWRSFYDEVLQFLVRELGVECTDTLVSVVDLQRFLMPAPARRYPDSVALAHDYVAYYASASRTLYTTGQAGTPEHPLEAYPPSVFTIAGDPTQTGDRGLHYYGDARDPRLESDFHMGGRGVNELDSPLLRRLPPLARFESPSTGTLLDVMQLTLLDDSLELAAAEPQTPSQPVQVRLRGTVDVID